MKFLRSRHFNLFAVIAGLLVIISFLVEFNSKIKEIVESEMFNYLHEIRNNAVYILKTEIEQFQNLVRNEARVIGLLGDSSEKALLTELKNFPKPESMLRGHIFTVDGKFFASNENLPRQYDPSPFRKSLGNIEGGISSPRFSNTFNKMIVDISAPLFIKGKYLGLLVGSYDIGHINKLLLNNFLKGGCSIYIATASGDIIYRSTKAEMQMNLNEQMVNFNNANKIYFSHESQMDSHKNTNKAESGCFKYFADGSARYISYAPAGINNWYIAAVSTEESLSAQITQIRDSAVNLTTGVSLLIAVVLALFIFNKMNEEREKRKLLKHLAETDMLTKLYNKFSCENKIDNELKTGSRCALLMIDIDGFKHVNDYLGHAKGDEILSDFGGFLGELPGADIAGRLGGDEFCVLMKNYGSAEKIASAAQKICGKLRRIHSVESGGHKEAKTSASIGIALFPEDGTTFDELYRKADEALYRSKNTGKDRFSFFG